MNHPRRVSLFLLVATVLFGATSRGDEWRFQRIHEKFFAEGASAGDINGDGKVDIVAGPIWYEGPTFERKHLIAAPREFPITTYSDQFFSQTLDANDDGSLDVLVLGFPGRSARLYLNPGTEASASTNQSEPTSTENAPSKHIDSPWKMTEVAPIVDNESPAIVDLVPGGLPEIVCGANGQYGYYAATEDPTQAWTWTPITRPGACAGRFAHGMGVGDVNGDGRLDILDKTYWWEHPADSDKGSWTQHRWAPSNYGQGGSQIEVYDVDGDGDQDIVTSLNAHGFGLAWFEQTSDSEPFVRHDIMGPTSLDNDYGIAFSQLHALDLVDMDGDGLKDIVTGKRWMAHQGKDAGGLQEAVLYWFQCIRSDDGVEFIPFEIHRDSGVGVDVLVTDLNQDDKPDIVSSSKRGLSVHIQTGAIAANRPLPWNTSVGKDQSEYADGLDPQTAAEQILVPEGFHVDLIAAEPELTQPIAMCFDARGRIWVIEGHTYPTKAPAGEGKDRIIILEDSDADGSFETKKTFATGLNLASGIEVGFGGVWVGAAPELLFIPDADHDDVPDAEPQVLLDGWGYHDTHETLNSFTWGPDGWLYGCHGIFTHSKVGVPGAPESERVPLNAGVWRYHPTQHRFEVFAHGTSNPWGVDFTDQGEWFVSACVIPHMYHIQQGARYQRQAGQHFNSHTYDEIKTIADHVHYTGSIRDHAYWGDNKVTKPPAPMGTSLIGGGHAHAGLAIYNGDMFPKEYRGDLLFHNLHGHRLLRERVDREGSGFVAKHRPDFALARDHQEIGVGVMVGPDGAVYTSDWHDVQTCHNGQTEVWDRTNGRIFRMRYGDLKPVQINLWQETDAELVRRLLQDNGFLARQAQRILQERAAADRLDADQVAGLLDVILHGQSSQRDRLRALWTKHAIGVLTDSQIRTLLGDGDEYVRSWAIHFAGERFRPADSTIGVYTDADRESADFDFGEYTFRDSSRVVRRYLASLLQRLPLERRWPIMESLVGYPMDLHDPNLPQLGWYGFEPLVESDPARAYELAKKSNWPNLLRFTVRRAAQSAAGRDLLVAKLAAPSERNRRMLVMQELSAVAKSRAGVKMPAAWPDAFASISSDSDPQLMELARSLAVQFGDDSVLPHFRKIYSDPSQSAQSRSVALDVMKNSKDPELPQRVFDQIRDLPQELLSASVAALSQYSDPRIGETLLANFKTLDANSKTAALNTLASRKELAGKLVTAMESGMVGPNEVPAFIVRQIVALDQDQFTKRLETVWGRISTSQAETNALYEKYRQWLKPNAINNASANRGRVLYQQNCGQCHKLFGTGGDIGPEITGANRTNVDYWLENILEPNALIGKAYQVTTFLTADGRVLNGIVTSENEDAVHVQTATEQVVIAKDEIEVRKLSETSLMPAGQLETMTRNQVLELFHYLMSPTQVPPDLSLLRKPGTIVLEGEMLDSKASAGTARPQGMANFGKHWSGNEQLWWTGGNKDSVLTLSLPRQTGTYDLQIYFTKAVDYAIVNVSVEGTTSTAESQQADLFNRKVILAEPMLWQDLQFSDERPCVVKVTITGSNPDAVPSRMVGVDRIELIPSQK